MYITEYIFVHCHRKLEGVLRRLEPVRCMQRLQKLEDSVQPTAKTNKNRSEKGWEGFIDTGAKVGMDTRPRVNPKYT